MGYDSRDMMRHIKIAYSISLLTSLNIEVQPGCSMRISYSISLSALIPALTAKGAKKVLAFSFLSFSSEI